MTLQEQIEKAELELKSYQEAEYKDRNLIALFEAIVKSLKDLLQIREGSK